jgi:hypothetical protein
LEEDSFKEFEDMYKDHCANVLDAVTSLNFARWVFNCRFARKTITPLTSAKIWPRFFRPF